MIRWVYWGSCPESTYEDITALKETEKTVSWATFRKHIPGARKMLDAVGATWSSTTNKQIENSYFIQFFKGTFMGVPAMFFRWSGIEFIWTSKSTER